MSRLGQHPDLTNSPKLKHGARKVTTDSASVYTRRSVLPTVRQHAPEAASTRSTPTLVTRTMTGTHWPLRSLCSWKLRGELRQFGWT